MMKLHLLVFTAIVVATGAMAETNVQRRAVNRQAVRAKRIAQAGGLLFKPSSGKDIFIVNDQMRIKKESFFNEGQHSISGLLSYPIHVVSPDADVSNAGLVITLSDNANSPALMVAPEVPWAGVNVGALAADKPSEAILASRVQKEIWRAFLYAAGAANSTMQPCLMRTVRKPSDLDAHDNLVPKPDVLQRVLVGAKGLGISQIKPYTYRQACEEGWAPAPTNDIQKAIWDKIHAMPTEPLKIKPETKKVEK